MVLIRPKSPERSDVDLSWFKDTERSRVMVMDMKSRVCEANRKPTESRRTVAVYRNDSDVITSPRAGSDVRRIFNERKTGERTVMAAKMMTPFLNRLETYIPKQSWFKPNPIVDRLVGLTLHCFVLSMFVLSGLMVKALASICNFLLYVLADMAVERGRVPVSDGYNISSSSTSRLKRRRRCEVPIKRSPRNRRYEYDSNISPSAKFQIQKRQQSQNCRVVAGTSYDNNVIGSTSPRIKIMCEKSNERKDKGVSSTRSQINGPIVSEVKAVLDEVSVSRSQRHRVSDVNYVANECLHAESDNYYSVAEHQANRSHHQQQVVEERPQIQRREMKNTEAVRKFTRTPINPIKRLPPEVNKSRQSNEGVVRSLYQYQPQSHRNIDMGGKVNSLLSENHECVGGQSGSKKVQTADVDTRSDSLVDISFISQY